MSPSELAEVVDAEIVEDTPSPALAVVDPERHLTIEEVAHRTQQVKTLMRRVMEDGVHYGRVGYNAKTPSLFKSGAEKVCTLFRLSPSYDYEREKHERGHVTYTVRCTLSHIPTGEVWGSGLGECSTLEEKYRWREAVCDEEWGQFAAEEPQTGPPVFARVKYKHGKGGSHYTVKQVEQTPSDIRNTVLKMAKKRAYVAATLSATGASDFFTQDLEDLPPEYMSRSVPEPVEPKACDTLCQVALDAGIKSPARMLYLIRECTGLDVDKETDLGAALRLLDAPSAEFCLSVLRRVIKAGGVDVKGPEWAGLVSEAVDAERAEEAEASE